MNHGEFLLGKVRRAWIVLGAVLAALALGGTAAAHKIDPTLLVFSEVGEALTFSVSDCCTCQAFISVLSNDGSVCTVNAPQSGTAISMSFTVVATGPGTTSISVSWSGVGTDENGDPCGDTSSGSVGITVLEPSLSSANTTDTISVTDPINSFAGEFYMEEEPDVDLGGPIPVRFARYYGSSLYRENFGDRPLGNGWLHTYDFQMLRGVDAGEFVLVVTNRGRFLRFRKVASTWVLQDNADIPWQLVEDLTDVLLGDPANLLIYRFDTTGALTEIFDPNGNTVNLSYTNQRLTGVTDGLGRTLTLAYNGSGNLTAVSDGTRSRGYSVSSGGLASYTDAEGNATAYAYDTSMPQYGALMTTKTLPRGNTPFTNVYDSSGRITSQTDGASNVWALAYGASSTTVTDPTGKTRTHAYDTEGQVTALTSQVAGQIAYTYDTDGRIDSLAASGATAPDITYQYEYHGPSGNLSKITYPDATETTFTYEARTTMGISFYYPTLIANPNFTTDAFVYNAAGNLTSQTGRLSDTWTFTYDSQGNILTTTLPTAATFTFTYNANGTLATMKDSSNNSTAYGYDTFRRLDSITHPDTNSKSYTYDKNDNLLTYTHEASGIIEYTYNANRLLSSFVDGRSNTTTFTYDAMDRLLSVTAPNGSVSARTYDALGRIATMTDRNGNVSSLGFDPITGMNTSRTDGANKTWTRAFDANGAITSMTDPNSRTTTYLTNSIGQITQATSPRGAVWKIQHDSFDQLDKITDPLNQVTDFTYSPHWWLTAVSVASGAVSTQFNRSKLGLVETTVDSLAKNWVTGHDTQGRLATAIDPLGNSTTFGYNNRSRLSSVTYPSSLGTQTITYTPTGAVAGRSYSDGTSMSYGYDSGGALTSSAGLTLTADSQGAIVESNGLTIGRDPGGRVTTVTYATNKTVTYTYDGRNLPLTVTDWVGGTTTLSHDNAGRLTSIARPNGVTTTYTLDLDGNIILIEDKNGGTTLSSIALTRDLRGRISGATRSVPLSPVPSSSQLALTYDSASQVSAFTYDAMGRLTNDGTRAYTWDLASRLTSQNDGGGAATYTYDGAGKMISRTEGGTTLSYVWNYGFPMPVVATVERNASDDAYYVYTPYGQLLHRIKAANNSRGFYHFDEVGNTLFLTNGAATITDRYATTPYGVVLAESGTTDQPFVHMGRSGVMRDAKSDLYYMRSRFYDAGSARFLSRDLFNRSASPLETNPYSYARANPLLFSDPMGFNAQVIYDGGIHTDIAVDIWCGDQIIGTLKLGFFLTAYVNNDMGPLDSIGALGYGAPSTVKGQFSFGRTLGEAGRRGDTLTINGTREQDERLARQLLEWMEIGGIGAGMSPGEVIKSMYKRPKGNTSSTVRIKANATNTYGAYRLIGFSRVCNDFTDDALDVYYGEDWRDWWAMGNRHAGEFYRELVRYEHLRNNTSTHWLSYPQNTGN